MLTCVAVYHARRYNTSTAGGCAGAPCSHLCLAVPGGRRCACPDAGAPPPKGIAHEQACDAGRYHPPVFTFKNTYISSRNPYLKEKKIRLFTAHDTVFDCTDKRGVPLRSRRGRRLTIPNVNVRRPNADFQPANIF